MSSTNLLFKNKYWASRIQILIRKPFVLKTLRCCNWDIYNAIDATEDGGQIRISTCRSGDDAQIKFEDSGCGIASENLDKVFEPFFSTKSPGKGTGLGLSICYGIIEEHKGKILVSSDGVGKGATFTIILPVASKARRDEAS